MHEALFTGVGRPFPNDRTEPPEASAPDLPKVLSAAAAASMTILVPAGA